MPRPVKCRKVCHFPNILEFLPADDTEKKMPIVLTVDEYETIRLLDKKGYSQEQCAESTASVANIRSFSGNTQSPGVFCRLFGRIPILLRLIQMKWISHNCKGYAGDFQKSGQCPELRMHNRITAGNI